MDGFRPPSEIRSDFTYIVYVDNYVSDQRHNMHWDILYPSRWSQAQRTTERDWIKYISKVTEIDSSPYILMDTAMELVQLTSHGKHSVAPTKPFQVSQTSVLQPITNQDNILRGPETDFLVELDDARIWGMDFGSAQEPYADARDLDIGRRGPDIRHALFVFLVIDRIWFTLIHPEAPGV